MSPFLAYLAGFGICAAICLIVFGICYLAEYFHHWWTAIAKDEHEEIFNMGLPAKKSHK